MKKRFSKINDRISNYVRKTDYCWIWTGSKYSSGYGRLNIGRGVQVRAHRFMFEQMNGEIPYEMCVLHKCDVRECVNPDHLFLGTKKDNMQDCIKKGRHRYATRKGVESPNSKINSEQVVLIRKDYAAGFIYQKDLAKKYGISQQTVSKIVNMKTYFT